MSSFASSLAYIAPASFSPSVWTEPVYGLAGQAATSRFDDVLAAEGWINRRNDLKVIRRYRDDWDGMGASAPSPQLVDTAIRVLERMQNSGGGASPPSAVSGTPMGHVTLEWHMGSDYLEAELIDAWHIEWMMERDGQFREWTERLIEEQPSGQYISTLAIGAESRGLRCSSSSISVPDTKSFHPQ